MSLKRARSKTHAPTLTAVATGSVGPETRLRATSMRSRARHARSGHGVGGARRDRGCGYRRLGVRRLPRTDPLRSRGSHLSRDSAPPGRGATSGLRPRRRASEQQMVVVQRDNGTLSRRTRSMAATTPEPAPDESKGNGLLGAPRRGWSPHRYVHLWMATGGRRRCGCKVGREVEAQTFLHLRVLDISSTRCWVL